MNLALIAAAVIAAGILLAMGVRALGGNIGLISDWKKALTFYSNYAWGLVLLLPDAINGAIAAGLFDGTGLDSTESWIIRGTAIFGFLTRFVKQAPKPEKPVFGED